ncbi:MAG: GNAT family N-acetyltransferase [Alphaproteobacteria bacterium]|nr:GNAT family N-acetyltransferase [Alphaproteobacteria bacterium SS10]
MRPQRAADDPRDRAIIGQGRVCLGPPQPTDYQAWADLRRASRDSLQPWEPTWPNDALSRTGFSRRITHQCNEWNADRAYNFLIWRVDDGVLLGGMALSNIRRGVAQAGTLGYWIGAAHRQQGYMGEALSATLKFGFDELDLNRLEAATLVENEPSRRLLGSAGFNEEGLAAEYLKINGQWADHVLYGLTRRSWSPTDQSAETDEPDFI